MNIINVTPHPINFLNNDGTEFEVPTSRWVISASTTERIVEKRADGVVLVETVFVSTDEGREAINEIYSEYGPDAIIVGSIIAAQAYPGQVVAMTPAAGFERVPPAEKRMNPHKFTIFPAGKIVVPTSIRYSKIVGAAGEKIPLIKALRKAHQCLPPEHKVFLADALNLVNRVLSGEVVEVHAGCDLDILREAGFVVEEI